MLCCRRRRLPLLFQLPNRAAPADDDYYYYNDDDDDDDVAANNPGPSGSGSPDADVLRVFLPVLQTSVLLLGLRRPRPPPALLHELTVVSDHKVKAAVLYVVLFLFLFVFNVPVQRRSEPARLLQHPERDGKGPVLRRHGSHLCSAFLLLFLSAGLFLPALRLSLLVRHAKRPASAAVVGEDGVVLCRHLLLRVLPSSVLRRPLQPVSSASLLFRQRRCLPPRSADLFLLPHSRRDEDPLLRRLGLSRALLRDYEAPILESFSGPRRPIFSRVGETDFSDP